MSKTFKKVTTQPSSLLAFGGASQSIQSSQHFTQNGGSSLNRKSSQIPQLQNRPSLINSNTQNQQQILISQVTGVSHLQDKTHLSSTKNSSSGNKKRETQQTLKSTSQTDYYTVQNNNSYQRYLQPQQSLHPQQQQAPQAAGTTTQTSRNQVQQTFKNQSQSLMTIKTAENATPPPTLFINKFHTPVLQQQYSGGSHVGVINSFKISHDNHIKNNKSQGGGGSNVSNPSSIRHSVLISNEFKNRDSLWQATNDKNRALSTSKSDRHSLFGGSQGGGATSTIQSLAHKPKPQKHISGKQSQLLTASPSIAYNDSYHHIKSSTFIQSQMPQYSPKPPSENYLKQQFLNQPTVYRSPQQQQKKNVSQSPLQSNLAKGNTSRLSTSTNENIGFTQLALKGHRNNHQSKSIYSQSKGIGSGLNIHSCLHIDLSSLSNNNNKNQVEDEDSNLTYGNVDRNLIIQSSLSQMPNFNNLQPLSAAIKSQKKKDAPVSSQLSKHNYRQIHVTSSSPKISSYSNYTKSPKTIKAQNPNRNSILNNFGIATQKALKQSDQVKNKTHKTNFTMKAKTSGKTEDKLKMMMRLKSQEDLKQSESYDDNFSFNSNGFLNNQASPTREEEDVSRKSITKQLMQNLSQPSLKQSLPTKHTQLTLSTNMAGSPKNKVFPKHTSGSQERRPADPYLKRKTQERYPMSKAKFLEKYQTKLLQFEIAELKAMKDDERVYFAGQALAKQPSYLKIFKHKTVSDLNLDDEEGYYNVLLGDHLMYRYEILKILGKGSFAQVVACTDHKTSKRVAIKITRNTELDHKFALSESKILNFLMEKDPRDEHHIVRMLDEFYFRDHHCFVFELLQTDLFEHLKDQGFIGFNTQKIRMFTKQILEALVFLEGFSLIHCDLKPENILLCDDKYQTLKLVDYGSGCFTSEQVYTYVQSRFYRAPEVLLRIPYTPKVDIWSLGCILVELYTGEPLFPGENEQEQLELIMELCGIPSSNMIDKSRKKDHYFDTDYSPFLIEDESLGILRIPASKTIEEVLQGCDDDLFIAFIKECLILEPENRMSAKQAMQHPWIQSKQSLLMHQPSNISLQSHHPIVNQPRQREEDKTVMCEVSPIRDIQSQVFQPMQQSKKSQYLNQAHTIQITKISVGKDDSLNQSPEEENKADSNMSSPKDEGGIQLHQNEYMINNIVAQTEILQCDRSLLSGFSVDQKKIGTGKKEREGSNVKQVQTDILKLQSMAANKSQPKDIRLIGKYEITRGSDEEQTESGVASEAHIPVVNQHETINNENTINKITVTFYQKRHHQKVIK